MKSRKILLEKIMQRGNVLTVKTKWYKDFLENNVVPLIKEDFAHGDITTDLLIHDDFTANAEVIARQKGIIAGIEEARFLYAYFGIESATPLTDGSFVKEGDIILKLKGSVKTLLKTERKIVDLIGRMSGIATMTYNLRKHVKDKIKISATRKTLIPYLDKKAVFTGGGITHRIALWDGILVKDNHFALKEKLSLVDFFAQAEKKLYAEVEVNNQENAFRVISDFRKYRRSIPMSRLILVIMFDNLKPSAIKGIIQKLKSNSLYDNILYEASGNITENNIKDYANTGIDYVSLGSLTHSVHGFDLTQKIKC